MQILQVSWQEIRINSANSSRPGDTCTWGKKHANIRYGRSPLDLLPYQELPKRIQVATDYPEQQDPAAQEIVNDFLESLDKTLGFTLVHLDLEDRLAQRNFTRQWYDNLDVKYKSSVYW